ncbi:MAG TPA: TetR family transcriptional regulator [Solirubrobacteraceae bacterium]|jgi:AcrR family transcriptional regulator|nr:TetR family transcriptional regulator [Solirubrobacteraceae bacterium]
MGIAIPSATRERGRNRREYMTLTYGTRTAATSLPRPGQPELGRREVAEIQRSRLLAATVEVVQEVGYARMTVARVIERARVSRKTFYDTFSDREECFLGALEQALEHARELAVEAYEREPGWRDGIRAALARLLIFMDEEPALAKLCVIEALGAGERVLQRRAEVLEELAVVIDRGRLVTQLAHEPPQITAEGIVGAIFAVVHTRLLKGRATSRENLLGSLMSMIVLPYLGEEAASRELSRPPLATARILRTNRRSPKAHDSLAGLNMRLTYRTVRVLMIVAEHPGASNREIADGSGVVDQGQISKLLTRLQRLKLVKNEGGGAQKGAANAWQLTRRGTQLERAVRLR